MNANIDQTVVRKIRHLYQSDKLAQTVFDWTAQRKNDASATSVETFSRELSVSRADAVALCRRMAATGCGEFKNGRRGQRSRLEWGYSCISLGRAAAGESSELEAASTSSNDVDEEEAFESGAANRFASITINEAKAGLAASLGVSVSNIEITIRS